MNIPSLLQTKIPGFPSKGIPDCTAREVISAVIVIFAGKLLNCGKYDTMKKIAFVFLAAALTACASLASGPHGSSGGSLKKEYTVALPATGDNGLAGKERKREADGFIYDVSEPQMTFYIPKKGIGKMVVICPGGGYAGVSMLNEGDWAARWLAERGFASCVLKYRMPNGHYDIPLADVQTALRYCRKNFRMKQIGIMGFSAGGHLAASASTLFTDKATRPDFSILFYPVISMADEITHRGSKKNLLREAVSDAELVKRFSLEKQVSADTPPTFITLCATDKVVPQENSIRYNDALKAHGVPCEMVVFPEGPHGFGFREGEADTIKPYRQQLYDALDKWLSRL